MLEVRIGVVSSHCFFFFGFGGVIFFGFGGVDFVVWFFVLPSA